MARNYVPQLSEFPYHITSRCSNKVRFPTQLDETYEILEKELLYCQYKYGLKIYSFVMMPNHIHLICSTEHVPIGKIMCEFFSNSTKRINLRANKINQLWGGKYYKCVLSEYHHFVNTYKYVYQNPLRAKLVKYSEEWKYSTLRGVLGKRRLNLKLERDTILFNPDFDQNELEWLNQVPDKKVLEMVRNALRKSTFKLVKSSHGKENIFNHQFI